MALAPEPSPQLHRQQRPREPRGTAASWVRTQSSSGKLVRADHKLCSARQSSSLQKTWSYCNNSFSTPCCAQTPRPFAPRSLQPPNPIYLAFLGSPRLGELRGLRILQEVPQSRVVEVACTWGSCLEVVGKYLKKTTPGWYFGSQTMGQRAHRPESTLDGRRAVVRELSRLGRDADRFDNLLMPVRSAGNHFLPSSSTICKPHFHVARTIATHGCDQ